MATVDVRVIGESSPGSTGGSGGGFGGGGFGGGGFGGGGRGGGGHGRGDGGRRDMDDEEDEEEDLSKFSRRKCQRCGKMEYLRKGGCANPACELFFATQANWQYAQKGSDSARSWSDRSQYSSMLQRKSKGSRHRDRGFARGYSTTERARRPRATAAAAAAGTHEPAASVPAAPVPAASEAASSVPPGILALQKRSAFPSPAGARGPWHTPYAFVASGATRINTTSWTPTSLLHRSSPRVQMEIGVTWQQSMLPAVGGDQFGAALAAVPPVAGVADMLAAMMGGAASARPAFPGLPAPANGPPAVPPAGTAAVTPAVAAEVPVGTVPAEAEPGESEAPSRRRRAAKAKAKRAAKPAAKKAAAKKAAAKKVKKPAKGRKGF
ncbi:unnamed protein product [Cladocopium goreaui]|uniref:Uncharacterized protein n=1 Tax=Cladocopium goreaui TaxID=2562237 RepID=A0A9P1GNZ9_9DINO|nr:unnamed protein product [Cladocopium goreaui]